MRPVLGHSNLYVSLSRVRKSDDLRFLPGNSTGHFNHLTSLQPNQDLVKWLKGFNRLGYWEHQRCL